MAKKSVPTKTKNVSPAPKPIFPQIRKFLTQGWVVITAVGTLLGVWGGVTYFPPKIEMAVSESLFPDNPFFSKFEIKNASNFAITDIRLQCQGIDLRPIDRSDKELEKTMDLLNSIVMVNGANDVPDMDAGTEVTKSCGLSEAAGGENLKESLRLNGSIVFRVRFHYLFWPRRIIRSFTFKAFVDGNGHTIFTKQPLTEEQKKILEKQDGHMILGAPDSQQN